MNTSSVIIMLSIGVIGATSEKVLNCFGKVNEASFVNIATLSSLGITALKIVADLIKILSGI